MSARVELEAQVVRDGAVALRWRAVGAIGARGPRQAGGCYQLLIMRTGAIFSHTALQLASSTESYQITGLSRHQRYLIAVLAIEGAEATSSAWLSVTPRAGLAPREERGESLELHLARVRRFVVMPQDRRLVAYWQLERGFVDGLALELRREERVLRRLMLEPEVSSVSLDAARGVRLANGERYSLALAVRFAGQDRERSLPVACTPAPQGEERAANSGLPQGQLVYPFLALGPELRPFPDDDVPASSLGESAELECMHCHGRVAWRSYRLLCQSCEAEFVPNGRGHYLDVRRLRFGVCQCCLPRRILIQGAGSEGLRCAHSRKEHIRLPAESGFRLIEDLPFGLCQCCRPRRPLERGADAIRCTVTHELHQRSATGGWALAPSQPVFDAAAIDELLDAGMAEICEQGVSRGGRR